jgi:hypothetical protein
LLVVDIIFALKPVASFLIKCQMADVVVTKDTGLTMELDANERALLDEIDIQRTIPLPKPPMRKPPPYRPPMRPVAQMPQTPMEEYGEMDPSMDAFMNPVKRSVGGPPPPPEEWDGGMPPQDEFEMPGGMGGGGMGGGMPMGPQPSEGYTSIEDEKADLLNKLARLEKKGFKTSGKLSTYSDIEQIRTEYKRIMYQIETDQSVKVARRVMIACVTGLEFLNKRYDPFDLELDGWSENMMENVDDYDTVFEELHAKYKNKVAVAPEIKLLMMVGGSAMMFHLSKSIFKQAGISGGDALKNNPQLVQNMMDAIKKTAAQNSQGGERPPTPRDMNGRREMRGPGIDLGSLMTGFMAPPPPSNSRPVVRETQPAQMLPSDDDLSDIVSITSDTKDVTIKSVGRKRTTKKKKEVTL